MMYGSTTPPVSKDLNLPYPPSTPFGGGNLKDDADSDLLHRQQQQQMGSGLLRFRSAPSSLFGEVCEDFLSARPSSPGADTMFARFLTPELRDKPSIGTGRQNPQFSAPQPVPAEEVAPHMMYHPHHHQQMPNRSTVESAYHVASTMAMDHAEQVKNGGVTNPSNLLRQSSSPAGLFSHLNEVNGYGMARRMGAAGDGGSRLSSQISFSSRQSSIMSQISEMESEGMGGSSPERSGAAGHGYLSGFPVTSWEHNSLMQDNNFSGSKRSRGGEGKMMATEQQVPPSSMLQYHSDLISFDGINGEVRNHVSGLAHQFSLPKTASEMAAIEKILQFQDAVPCKLRAKRGCATHPRSIAERARRTKISERMRKLQELVPNMDKQTNTADMLDLAVDYIKDLQKQVKVLNEARANCTCAASRA